MVHSIGSHFEPWTCSRMPLNQVWLVQVLSSVGLALQEAAQTRTPESLLWAHSCSPKPHMTSVAPSVSWFSEQCPCL